MHLTKKDWIDFLLTVIGACLGVGFFGFIAAPFFGLEFIGGKPVSYMLAAASGTVCAYALRFGFSCMDVDPHS